MEVAEECGWSNWTRLKRTEEKSQRHEILKNKQHYREEQLSQAMPGGLQTQKLRYLVQHNNL